ncbi:putative protein kinase RLK-Pelle-L-LEC family [Helianthus annuus]|nr:putative protein kinase RLK-Pelle-L-LEC family [Helianthus annuus]
MQVNDSKEQMVFYCRCFSFLLEEKEETEHETKTQTKSTATDTFYTAGSDFNRSASSIHARTSLADKPSNLRVFTLAELNEATENFCIDSKIGEGDFGTVYKGVINSLDHEIHVAVKLANKSLQVLNSNR